VSSALSSAGIASLLVAFTLLQSAQGAGINKWVRFYLASTLMALGMHNVVEIQGTN
jgi:hypothetical protein